MVGRTSKSHAQTDIDFPLWGDVQIDGRKNLVLLLGDGVESRHRTNRAVVFKAACNFGREVVTEFEIWREDDSLVNAFAVERTVERGVDGPIPASHLLIDNGSNFPGPRVDGKLAALVAELIGNTDSHRPVPLFRNTETRTYVVAYPLPSLTDARGGEDVKAGLKPVGPAMSNFNCFVHRMICGEKAIDHLLRAVDSEVAMQLDHGVAGRNRLVAVDLNFVIILRGESPGKENQSSKQENERTKFPYCSVQCGIQASDLSTRLRRVGAL